jgi:hypothetical protein
MKFLQKNSPLYIVLIQVSVTWGQPYILTQNIREVQGVFFIVALSTVGVMGILVHGKIASVGSVEPVFPFDIYLL